MNVSRKEFLKTTGIAALSLVLPGSTRALALAADGFPAVAVADLVPPDEMWSWMERLAEWSPTFTGGPGHTSVVNFLDAELRRSRLNPERKTFRIPYWELKEYGLKVGGTSMPVSGYRPYSGPTSAEGVTAPLYFAGTSPAFDFSGARGKIVIMEMAPVGGSGGTAVPTSDSVGRRAAAAPRATEVVVTYPPNAARPRSMGNALRGLNTDTSNMKPIEDAGAVGVIHVWNGVSDGNARDQAIPPFGTPTPVPVVLVGHATGQRLKALASSGGASATLIHHAVIHPDMPADNIWAVLPGQTDETIIINTHTDGCNANEENGFFGVVALARYFAGRPPGDRRRTLVFLMTAGHFGHGYFRGTADWIQTHDDVMKRAVACVTIEHLGALGWIDDPAANVYKPTGQGEWAPAYTPLRPEADVFLSAAQGTDATNIYAAVADTYAGEGQAFHRAGIPCISYIPTPQYLFIAPSKGGALDKMSKMRMHGEVVTFARAVAALDKMSVAALRGADQ
jgi:hypothetical protein